MHENDKGILLISLRSSSGSSNLSSISSGMTPQLCGLGNTIAYPVSGYAASDRISLERHFCCPEADLGSRVNGKAALSENNLQSGGSMRRRDLGVIGSQRT